MGNKKIAFFLQNLSGGGAEKSVVNLSNYLVNDGVDIDIILVEKKSAVYLKELDTKIRVIDLDKSRSLKAIFGVKKYIKNNEPDVVMSSVTHINVILSIVKLITGKTKTKIAINQVNHLSSIINYYINSKILRRFLTKIIIYMYNFTDGSISMSKGVERDLLINGLKVKSKHIYNPIFLDSINDQSKYFDENKSHKKTFIAIGRMVPQKNFGLLIDAFSLVNNEIESELVILGDGPLRNELEKQIAKLGISKNIILKGFVDNPFKHIKKADVFVLTSLWEGFGNVIVESLALGTQVVSTSCDSGPNEILENGKYGFLSTTFHKFEIARLMIEAINNPIDSKLLIRRGEYYSVERSAKSYKDFLLNI